MILRQKPNDIWAVDFEGDTGVRHHVSTGIKEKTEAKKRALHTRRHIGDLMGGFDIVDGLPDIPHRRDMFA